MKKQSILFCLFLIMFLSKSIYAADAFATFGDVGQITFPIVAIGTTYYYKDWQGFTEFAYAFLTTETTVQILKHTVHRTRPNGSDQSFPSGHTASAFVSASFLQMRYGWSYGIPAYLIAAAIGYSRIESRNHWTTDVLAGAAIGIGSNLIFTHKFKADIGFCPYFDASKKEGGLQFTTEI